MKNILTILLLALVTITSWAVDIPAGTFYYDNSLTNYTHVKFVYGSDSKNVSYVKSMTFDQGSRWKITFDTKVSNMYRYTFANTSLPDGTYNQTFIALKDSISNSLNEYRTSTTDATITAGYIYTPASGDNWASGSWQSLSGGNSGSSTSACTAAISRTLPVLYINTTNGQAISDSKEEYTTGTYYLDSMGISKYRSYGSAASPLTLNIRRRGNWTWSGFDKKPYKIKLDDGKKLMGMHKSKQWALMAGADDNLGFLRNTVGFMLSEDVHMRWTPRQEAVELVLNGEYKGLYFLTETIKIDDKRINITEQQDRETNKDSITGGWLVEIDNYTEDGQVVVTEGNGQTVRVTIHSPELLSASQTNYISSQINELNTAFYESSSAHWEQLVDLDELAKFYLVQEIMEDTESFHGSCYFYKDRGNNQKWYFGPVWDFGNSYNRSAGLFIYDQPTFEQYWIGQIATFPNFQYRVKQFWYEFLQDAYPSLQDSIQSFVDHISTAACNDGKKWPDYSNADMTQKMSDFMAKINWRVNWLKSQWGEGIAPLSEHTVSMNIYPNPVTDGNLWIDCEESVESIQVIDMTGRQIPAILDKTTGHVSIPQIKGMYIIQAETTSGAKATSKILVQ